MSKSVSSLAVVGVAFVFATSALAADVESLPGGVAGRLGIAQQCLKDLQAFEAKLVEVGFGLLPPVGFGPSDPYAGYNGAEGTPRQKMQALREAANVYAWAGDEKSCQFVLTSMRAVYEEHQKLIGTEADDPNLATAWRRAHLARAKPAVEMDHLMRANILIGSEIRSPNDEKLGEIDDVVLSSRKQDILYVLVARAGFLGFRKKLVAVRWSDLRATEDHELYLLDTSPKAFD